MTETGREEKEAPEGDTGSAVCPSVTVKTEGDGLDTEAKDKVQLQRP